MNSYSTGSSSIIRCTDFNLLTASIILANKVVFPEPVGPVINTKPEANEATSFIHSSSLSGGNCFKEGSTRIEAVPTPLTL